MGNQKPWFKKGQTMQGPDEKGQTMQGPDEKGQNRQKMDDKILQRKLKIVQHEPH